jgi:hypothetical protein
MEYILFTAKEAYIIYKTISPHLGWVCEQHDLGVGRWRCGRVEGREIRAGWGLQFDL